MTVWGRWKAGEILMSTRREVSGTTYQSLDRLHDPFSTAAIGRIANDANECELGAQTEDGSLSGDAGSIFLLALFGG